MSPGGPQGVSAGVAATCRCACQGSRFSVIQIARPPQITLVSVTANCIPTENASTVLAGAAFRNM